jgi:hypothetical protein
MTKTILYFNQEDTALNLSATVSWRDRDHIDIPDLSVRGLGKWRHAPANMLACSSRAIDMLKLGQKAPKLSKIGILYFGLESKTDIMISKNIREGKNGTKHVIELLKKFFIKGCGASSVVFKIHEAAESNSN